MMSPTRDAFVDAVASEVGYTESPAGSNKTKFAKEAGHANGFAWCQTFLNALAKRTGLEVPVMVLATAYTPTAVNEWKRAGAWHQAPDVGDWAYFQFDDDPQVDHVALVVAVGAKSITTIEGNTSFDDKGSQANGGAVARRVRSRSLVRGYGRPAYAPKVKPQPAAAVIVKEGSVEQKLLELYPDLFGRAVRVFKDGDIPAAANPNDIGFGTTIWGAKLNVVGATRYETLVDAIRTVGL
jgi:hypothetical protein